MKKAYKTYNDLEVDAPSYKGFQLSGNHPLSVVNISDDEEDNYIENGYTVVTREEFKSIINNFKENDNYFIKSEEDRLLEDAIRIEEENIKKRKYFGIRLSESITAEMNITSNAVVLRKISEGMTEEESIDSVTSSIDTINDSFMSKIQSYLYAGSLQLALRELSIRDVSDTYDIIGSEFEPVVEKYIGKLTQAVLDLY